MRQDIAPVAGADHLADMSMSLTLVLFAASLAAAVFFGWRGAQPPDLLKGPRMLPYRFLMVVAAAAGLVFLVHIVNLLGFVTGR